MTFFFLAEINVLFGCWRWWLAMLNTPIHNDASLGASFAWKCQRGPTLRWPTLASFKYKIIFFFLFLFLSACLPAYQPTCLSFLLSFLLSFFSFFFCEPAQKDSLSPVLVQIHLSVITEQSIFIFCFCLIFLSYVCYSQMEMSQIQRKQPTTFLNKQRIILIQPYSNINVLGWVRKRKRLV